MPEQEFDESSSSEELDRINIGLSGEKEAIRQKQRRLAVLMDRKAAEEKLRNMSDADRGALVQAVKAAGGIDSLERMGLPGGGAKPDAKPSGSKGKAEAARKGR